MQKRLTLPELLFTLNLVTGATGILGSHVVLQLLLQNKPVIAAKQKNSDIKKTGQLFSYYNQQELFKKIIWKDMDITDVFSIEEALEGVDTVYHCAGCTSFNKRDRKQLFKINETGTANVVTACIEKKVKALCHVSSIAAINNLDHKDDLNEDVFWKTSGTESDYALSKYGAERQVWRGMEEGLNAVIVNPGVILSPGFWQQSSSRLFATVNRGNPFYTTGVTGYISAEDTAKAMIALTEGRHFANRYILIENNYSFKQILDTISTQLGKRKPFLHAGNFLLQIGRFFNYIASRISGKEQAITGAVIRSALGSKACSNTKVKKALGINFTPVEKEIIAICRLFKESSAIRGPN